MLGACLTAEWLMSQARAKIHKHHEAGVPGRLLVVVRLQSMCLSTRRPE